jgi:hypothetical protein
MKSDDDMIFKRAEDNLQRQLDWISRYDTRISFVAGICITMVGVLFSTAPTFYWFEPVFYLCFLLSALLLIASLVCVYLGQYPNTTSQNSSLIFFGTIATLGVDEFKKKFKNGSDDEYLDDLLIQCHVNAQIMDKKFRMFKTALILMLVSVVPWALTIYAAKFIL